MRAIKGDKAETLNDAMLLEQNGELKAAAAVYRELHKKSPKNLKILKRLMIVCRKLKDPVNEIRYIDAAITIHEQYYTSGKNADKKTIAISRKLNLLLGYTDKKGKAVFKPDEILRLEMRKNRVKNKQVVK